MFVEPKDIVIPSEPEYKARIAFGRGPLGEEIEFFRSDRKENMSDNQNNNPKGIIIGMLCLIWGLGSIAAMLFCSKLENHTGILLVLLGQFFL